MVTNLTTTSNASASHTSSVTRSQSRNKDRSAKILSPNTARRFTSRSTTALLLLVMTPRLSAMDMDMEREMLRLSLATMDTPLDLSASNMLRSSATRSPSRTKERSQDLSARPLLTPPTLRSVRTPSPLSALRPTPRSTTALLLLVMTPRSSREVTMAREMLSQAMEALDQSARSMLRSSATRFLSTMRRRFQERNARASQKNNVTQLPTKSQEKCVLHMNMDMVMVMEVMDMDMDMVTMENNFSSVPHHVV